MVAHRKNDYNFKERGRFEVDISMKKTAVGDPFTIVPPAEKMVLFLRQHVGRETKPIVQPGDPVKCGQKIGEINEGDPWSVPVHSPVDGKIVTIKKLSHPLSGEEENAVIIETTSEGQNSSLSPLNPNDVSKEQLVERVREAGIVGLGGASFPTHVKLTPNKKLSHLIINAKESDSNIACDFRLMVEKSREVVNGILLIAKILDVTHITFASRTKEGQTPEFDELLRENNITIARIRPNYSVGSERLLVKEVLNKEIPSGKFPPDVGVVVHNIATALAISRAVYNGEALISRGLTFYSKKTGGKNLWVRMGTPINHVLSFLGMSSGEFERYVLGSIMMGPLVSDPSLPILKATSGITAFTREERDPYVNPLPCIRCAYCNIVCPVFIYPQLIMEAEKKGNVKALHKLHVVDCIECGLCSYVCPSRIKLTPYLVGGKRRIREKKE